MSAVTLVALLAMAGTPSGPQVGDKLSDFKVHGVSGPEAGKEFMFLSQVKGKPALVIFVHKITRPGLQFLRPVDDYVSKEDKLAAHIVWLTGDKGDKDETEKFLDRAKNSLNLQTPVGICLDGNEGPAAYGLNDRVAITVLIAKEGKVVSNFALVDPNGNDAPPVKAAVAKALGKEAPKEDAQGKTELQPLLRRLLAQDIDEAGVSRVIAAIKKWAGDDADRRQQLQRAAQRVLGQNLGNETAQRALKKLTEE
jgi:hypothetical protein